VCLGGPGRNIVTKPILPMDYLRRIWGSEVEAAAAGRGLPALPWRGLPATWSIAAGGKILELGGLCRKRRIGLRSELE
jgi:hypothetical protein